MSSQPHIVGAKGGIRFDHRHRQATQVLERFIRDHASVISQFWATGGDLNTSHELIDQCAKRHCGPVTKSALDALLTTFDCATAASDLSVLLREPVTVDKDTSEASAIQWPVQEYAVGYVVAVTLQEIVRRTRPKSMGTLRIAMQGFGTVGATFAHAVHELGIGKIVAISSQHGFLLDDEGIDIDTIIRVRNASAEGRGLFDPRTLEAGLTAQQLADERRYKKRFQSSTDEEHLSRFFTAVKADAFVPCAGRYIFTPNTLQALAKSTLASVDSKVPRFLVCGANNTLAPNFVCSEALALLDAANIKVVPEWVSNSGTANLFMRAVSGLALPGNTAVNLAACADDAVAFLSSAFDQCEGSGRDIARLSTIRLWQACEKTAALRRQAGAVNLLGIRRIATLKLITSDVQRSRETMVRVCRAEEQPSGTYRLPGSNDPTFHVLSAPQGASPAETGLIIQFAVCNIEKARHVLKRQGLNAIERTSDSLLELEVGPAQIGYHLSLVQDYGPDPNLPKVASGIANTASTVLADVKAFDHYTLIVSNADAVKALHERLFGFVHMRTIRLNAGSAPQGEHDMLNHVLHPPFDPGRALVITQGLRDDSVFAKLMRKKTRPYVHHFAMEVGDVRRDFRLVREAGWATTSEEYSKDPLSGLKQFFLREEETPGCFLELIQRSDPSARGPAHMGAPERNSGDRSGNEELGEGDLASGKGETTAPAKTTASTETNAPTFQSDNMISLAQTMERYAQDE